MLSTHNRQNTSAPRDGSRTIIVRDAQPRPEGSNDSPDTAIPNGTLRLRGGPRSSPRVAWDEHVIDNEDCGRKKSKICCIYHKPKEFDESSEDESSSDSDADSDSDPVDDGRARPRHAPHRHHHHLHPSDASHNGAGDSNDGNGLRHPDDRGGVVHEIESAREVNAYEIQPLRPKKGKGHVDC